MARHNITPRDHSLALLNEALDTGIRGRNREAIQSAIETLEDNGRSGLTDLHYTLLPVGQTLRDPNRRGLWMRRNKSAAIWLFNYTSPVTGKEKARQFGTYPKMSLVQAREQWQDYRDALSDSIDPFVEAEVDAAARVSIKDLCEKYIREYAKVEKRTWKEDQRMLDYDLVPAHGGLSSTDLTRDHLETLFDEITERGSPRSAEKLLTCVRKMFNHAIKKRWVAGLETNPCLHIELRKRKTSTAYLKEPQIRSFIRNLPKADKVPETIKDILVLQFQTVARVGEVCGLTWDELDLRHGNWHLPASRAKNKEDHKVILSEQSVALLERRKAEQKALKKEGSKLDLRYVFPSERTSQPYPPTLVARHLKNNRSLLKVPDTFSTHGLRHTAMTQLASMGCGKELRDRISNHRDTSVDAIYQHHEHDKEAGEWWQAWADRLDDLGADSQSKGRAA